MKDTIQFFTVPVGEAEAIEYRLWKWVDIDCASSEMHWSEMVLEVEKASRKEHH